MHSPGYCIGLAEDQVVKDAQARSWLRTQCQRKETLLLPKHTKKVANHH